MSKGLLFGVLAFIIVVLTTCIRDLSDNFEKVDVDYTQIRERGKLVVATALNSTDYFIYRGRPMGFQFELLKNYAEYSGLQLEIIAIGDVEEAMNMLLTGKCDIIAQNLLVTKEKREFISFTIPVRQSRQVLVQRIPDNWNELDAKQRKKALITNPIELAGKTVYVQRHKGFGDRLRNLADEIGSDIDVVDVLEESEQLIKLVANKEIDFAVVDEGVALVNKMYYEHINVNTAISFPQNLAWGVRKNSVHLLSELDKWLVQFKNTARYATLFSNYYKNQRSARIVNSDYYVINTGKISAYDEEIKKFSKQLNWDWRLLASIISMESNFNPKSKSHAGAYGLMQIMPATAQRFGVDSVKSPIQNIAIGVKLLVWLNKNFSEKIGDGEERLKFVLASYNIGIGHIIDARNLALKYGKNPCLWDDVEKFLLNKSQPRYYKDPVVKFGYCKGIETSNYVEGVLSLYSHYKNISEVD